MNGKQLKNSILQWAIQGKLVPQDPNDEPASVLLEKIRQEKERLIKEKKIKRDKNASIIYRGEDNSYYEKILATGEVKCIDEEIPFDVPNGWEWCRIASLADVVRGGSPRPAGSPIFYDGSIPFLKVADLTRESSIYVKSFSSTIKEAGLSKTRLVEAGALLLTNSGATLGVPKICTFETTFNDGVAAFLSLDERLKLYVYWFFCYMTDLYRNINQGTAQPNLNTDIIKMTLVPIPPYKEQIRIIEQLGNISPIIEHYEKAQDELDELNESIRKLIKQSILQEAIQGKLVPQIGEEGTAKELLEQIKAEKQKLVKEGKLKKSALATSVIFRGDDNKYWEKEGTTCECIDEDIPFDVPKSWAWVRLETILNIGSARRVHAKDWRQAGIPFYRAREIGKLADDGFVDNELYIDLSLYEDFSSSGVPLPNDLMITAVGTLGKVYIVKESDKFYYKDGSVLCLANKYGLCAEYLKMVIESPFFKGQYRQESQGTTVATLTMVRLQKYFIPIPPLQEQYRIVETYRNIASIMS